MQIAHFGICCVIFCNVFALCEKCATESKPIYLELGEKGRLDIGGQNAREKMIIVCGIELVTCPFCQLELKIEYSNPSNLCSTSDLNINNINCTCGKILIRDHTNNISTMYLCSTSNSTYITSTRSLFFSYDGDLLNDTGILSFIYESRRSLQQIVGQSIVSQNIEGYSGQSGIITSPYFPLNVLNYKTEYVLSCINENYNCVVTLLFTDYLRSPTSIIEFFDSDGKLIEYVPRNGARPSHIVSSGSSLKVRFYSNGPPSLVYKAKYEFTASQNTHFINTECGGEIQDSGGSIYMHNMSGVYDCVWIIKPINMYYFKTDIYLNVLEFSGKNDSKLIIHDGSTSNSPIIDVISNDTYGKKYVTSVSRGFYVSYNGNLLKESKLNIAYAIFSYLNCLPVIDYQCLNNRCILSTLVCDSIDHCGDKSDEKENCSKTINNNQYWWPLRDSRENPNKTTVGLWMCGVFFLSALFFIGINTCRRIIYNRVTDSNNLTASEQIRTIAQLISIEDTHDYDTPPPMYEPPPDYDQALKTSSVLPHGIKSMIGNDSGNEVASASCDNLQIGNHNEKMRKC